MTGRETHSIHRLVRAARMVSVLVAAALWICRPAAADSTSAPADVVAITISADYSQEWDEADGHVSLLRGHARIAQGATVLQAQKMVVCRSTQSSGTGKKDRLSVYLEDDVRIEQPGSTLNDSRIIITLATRAGVTVDIRKSINNSSARDDALFTRANKRRHSSAAHIIRTTQLTESPEEGPELRTEQFQRLPTKTRRVRIRPRYGNEFNMSSKRAPNRTPSEQITTITGGVNIRIEGLDQPMGGKPVGTIEISADRIVIWSRGELFAATNDAGVVQSEDEPLEFYMEGNIVIFQGDPNDPHNRVVHAEYATFDYGNHKALLLNAELKEYIPALGGNLRIWAERIQQLGEKTFHAQHAWSTASPYGKPGYRLQSTDVFLEERYQEPTGAPAVDAATGEPVESTKSWVTALNNALFIDDLPVFYLPYISAPADKSNMPLQSVLFGQDRILGAQVRTQWDPFKLFGFKDPANSRWSLLGNFFSERGAGGGLSGTYKGNDLFGTPGQYKGELLGLYQFDHGTDDLGFDRRALIPATEDRGRLEWRHQQTMPEGFTLDAELGYLSDRNFLEQYYQWEFDRNKDVETLLYLKQQQNNWAWSGLTTPMLNKFENTTQWLPRGDLYLMSQPLLNGAVTWSSHTSAGYAQLHQADAPTDPNDLYVPIPYFQSSQGAVLMTRNELDAPFHLGPVNLVPYFMGESDYWGQGLDGSNIGRLVASGGVRSTMEMFRAFPTVQSEILNLNGLAHRVLFEATWASTRATRDLSTIAQYNEFDDNSQERFRERLIFNDFGGTLPPIVDPRFYAVRTGAGMGVTAPYYELVDNQDVARFWLRQRLQTKVGPPDRLRMRDWMTLDLGISYFPNANRDDFGTPFGLATGAYAWNVSQRTSFLANAVYDFFNEGEQLWNVAVLSQRSERGSVYLGVRQVKAAGVLNSDIATASYSYQMSTKWISTMGTSYDLAEKRSQGQSFTITRVGLDFIMSVAGNYDVSTNNVGFALTIEPRIGNLGNGQMTQLSNLLAGQRPH